LSAVALVEDVAVLRVGGILLADARILRHFFNGTLGRIWWVSDRPLRDRSLSDDRLRLCSTLCLIQAEHSRCREGSEAIAENKKQKDKHFFDLVNSLP